MCDTSVGCVPGLGCDLNRCRDVHGGLRRRDLCVRARRRDPEQPGHGEWGDEAMYATRASGVCPRPVVTPTAVMCTADCGGGTCARGRAAKADPEQPGRTQSGCDEGHVRDGVGCVSSSWVRP